jgi:hypothetical protein
MNVHTATVGATGETIFNPMRRWYRDRPLPPQAVRFVLPVESSRAFDDGVVAALWRKEGEPLRGSASKRSFIVPIVDAL